MNRPEHLTEKIRQLPDAPGCYLMRDARGRIIYVGKAASLRQRVASYFRDSTLRSADPKLRSLVNSVRDLEWIVVRNEAEAILNEGRLIKEYRPRYNVDFKDDKRFLLLRTDLREPLPNFSLCRIRREDGAVYFGPYASSSAARAALDFVEKTFGLRKCPPREPDAETYRHCMNDIIRFCSAPCVGRVSREDYRRRVDEACAFLRGERPQELKKIRAAMEAASSARSYEKAAAIRDTYLLLLAAVKQRARMAPTPAMRREEALAGLHELQAVLGLKTLPRVIEGYDISNISGTLSVAGMVCAVDGIPAKSRYRRFRIKSVEGIDDPRMMAEVIRRRFLHLAAEGGGGPDLVLVDGGITQVRAARTELQALGLASIPVAGLAKRYEELYGPVEGPPLRLPEGAAGLKVLQRLRDEAHRFAQAYHLKLRNRRIRDSALDDVQGIGPRKKTALLERFGSVARLSRASVEQIASVPGIGYPLAVEVLARVGAKPPAAREAGTDR